MESQWPRICMFLFLAAVGAVLIWMAQYKRKQLEEEKKSQSEIRWTESLLTGVGTMIIVGAVYVGVVGG